MSLTEPDRRTNKELDGLPFDRIGDAVFACHLPGGIPDKFIVELRPHASQTLADLTRWMMSASIASASLLPLIQRHRLPGAPRRLLTAAEIIERKLPAQAAMFELQNQGLAIGSANTQTIFQPNQALIIQCSSDLPIPSAVILYLSQATPNGVPTPQ